MNAPPVVEKCRGPAAEVEGVVDPVVADGETAPVVANGDTTPLEVGVDTAPVVAGVALADVTGANSFFNIVLKSATGDSVAAGLADLCFAAGAVEAGRDADRKVSMK